MAHKPQPWVSYGRQDGEQAASKLARKFERPESLLRREARGLDHICIQHESRSAVVSSRRGGESDLRRSKSIGHNSGRSDTYLAQFRDSEWWIGQKCESES